MAGARLARNDRTAVARSMVSTMPADPPFGSQQWLSDRASWCVDLGPTLQAMTTSELWLGLAKGEVQPTTKVWREGMPYWQAVARVPEFALALPETKAWSPASTQVTARLVAAMPVTARDLAEDAAPPSDRMAADPVPVGVVTLAPPCDFSTPAPVVVDHDAPAESGARQRLFPRLDRRGAASVVAGAVVAITALALATTGPAGSESRPGSAAGRPAAALTAEHGFLEDAPPAPPPTQEHSFVGYAPTQVGPPAPQEFDAVPPQESDATTGPKSTITTPEAAPKSTGLTPGRWRMPRGPHVADRGQRRARGGSR